MSKIFFKRKNNDDLFAEQKRMLEELLSKKNDTVVERTVYVQDRETEKVVEPIEDETFVFEEETFVPKAEKEDAKTDLSVSKKDEDASATVDNANKLRALLKNKAKRKG